MEKFRKAFRRLPDPRADNTSHELLEVLLIALAATLCGAEGPSDMATFGQSKEGLLRWCCGWSTGSPATTRSADLPLVGPAGLRGCIPAVHGGVRQGERAGAQRRGGDRRQGLAWGLRAGSTEHAAAHGQYLGDAGAAVFGSAQSPWSQRGHRRVGSARPAGPRRLYGYRRCAALPSRLCHDGARSGRAIRAGPQGKSEQAVHCRRPALCAWRNPQRGRTARTLHSRSPRMAARHRRARSQLCCRIRLSRRCCAGPHHLSQTLARGRAEPLLVRYFLLSQYIPPSACCARSFPLGYREPAALGARRGLQRGSQSIPKGPCPREPCDPPKARAQYRALPSCQNLYAPENQARRMDDAFLLGMLGHMR